MRSKIARTYAISGGFFRTTISLSAAHFSAPRVLLVFGVREYAWTRISRLARMVNFCKQELPFYWASSAILLPPTPSQSLSLHSLTHTHTFSHFLSLYLSISLLLPHFTATPNATIGIPNRSGTIQHHCFSEPALLVLLTSNPFTPRHRARPRFFPLQSPSLEKDNQPGRASSLIYAVLQIFRFHFFVPYFFPNVLSLSLSLSLLLFFLISKEGRSFVACAR